MSDEILYRPMTAADEPGIVELMRVSLAMQDFPDLEGFWRWKHVFNPHGVSPGMVATAGEQIVGVRVFLHWEWTVGDAVVRAVRAVDTATHPDWGRRGIFSRMTVGMLETLASEGVQFVFNTPNHSSLPGYLKMGWHVVGRVPLWVRPLRPLQAARAARWGRGGAHSLPSYSPAGRSVDAALSDPRLPRFLDSLPRGLSRFRTLQSVDHLRWRYAGNPWFPYEAGFRIRGDAGALAVVRGNQRGGLRELLVCDLLATPTRDGQRLARTVLRDLIRSSGADYAVGYAAPGTPERAVLSRSGFVPVGERGPTFTVRLLEGASAADEPDPDPRLWTSWRLSVGDLEIF